MGLLATVGAWLLGWSGSEGWRRRREALTGRSKPTYDAYPGLPDTPAIRFYAEGRDVRGRLLREYVDLAGYSLDQLNLKRGAMRGDVSMADWFTTQARAARDRLQRRLNAERHKKENP